MSQSKTTSKTTNKTTSKTTNKSRKAHENPYKRGSYKAIFDFAQRRGNRPVKRSELVDFAMKDLNMTEGAAKAAVGVILSPRQSSERGDCRGNFSAQGHLYYFLPLAKRKTKDDEGKEKAEELRLVLRWRTEALSAHTRPKAETVQQETTDAVETVNEQETEAEIPVEA